VSGRWFGTVAEFLINLGRRGRRMRKRRRGRMLKPMASGQNGSHRVRRQQQRNIKIQKWRPLDEEEGV
jgi:hypothetical protein